MMHDTAAIDDATCALLHQLMRAGEDFGLRHTSPTLHQSRDAMSDFNDVMVFGHIGAGAALMMSVPRSAAWRMRLRVLKMSPSTKWRPFALSRIMSGSAISGMP